MRRSPKHDNASAVTPTKKKKNRQKSWPSNDRIVHCCCALFGAGSDVTNTEAGADSERSDPPTRGQFEGRWTTHKWRCRLFENLLSDRLPNESHRCCNTPNDLGWGEDSQPRWKSSRKEKPVQKCQAERDRPVESRWRTRQTDSVATLAASFQIQETPK